MRLNGRGASTAELGTNREGHCTGATARGRASGAEGGAGDIGARAAIEYGYALPALNIVKGLIVTPHSHHSAIFTPHSCMLRSDLIQIACVNASAPIQRPDGGPTAHHSDSVHGARVYAIMHRSLLRCCAEGLAARPPVAHQLSVRGAHG
jgi:hypothetical protein